MELTGALLSLSRRLTSRCALAALAPCTACAELEWTQPVHTQTLAPGIDAAEVRFAFKNTGKDTIKITGLHSSCGCTTAQTGPKQYPPGTDGVVTVNYVSRGSLGLQTGTVTVTTDEPGREPYTLSINLTFTDWVSLTPRLLRWTLQSAPAPQRVQIQIPADVSLELLSVSSDSPAFSASLIAAEGRKPAAVEITPQNTASSARAVITLTVRPPGQIAISRTVYAQIR